MQTTCESLVRACSASGFRTVTSASVSSEVEHQIETLAVTGSTPVPTRTSANNRHRPVTSEGATNASQCLKEAGGLFDRPRKAQWITRPSYAKALRSRGVQDATVATCVNALQCADTVLAWQRRNGTEATKLNRLRSFGRLECGV